MTASDASPRVPSSRLTFAAERVRSSDCVARRVERSVRRVRVARIPVDDHWLRRAPDSVVAVETTITPRCPASSTDPRGDACASIRGDGTLGRSCATRVEAARVAVRKRGSEERRVDAVPECRQHAFHGGERGSSPSCSSVLGRRCRCRRRNRCTAVVDVDTFTAAGYSRPPHAASVMSRSVDAVRTCARSSPSRSIGGKVRRLSPSRYPRLDVRAARGSRKRARAARGRPPGIFASGDRRASRDAGRRHAELQPVVDAYRDWQKASQDLADANEMLAAEADAEMREYLKAEIAEKQQLGRRARGRDQGTAAARATRTRAAT